MSIGMTYEQYWYGDVRMAWDFLKAHELRMKREQEQTNFNAYLQGFYVYEAVGRLAPILHAFAKKGAKPKPYPKEPFDLTGKEEETDEEKEKREQAEALRAEVYMMNMVRAGQNWGK